MMDRRIRKTRTQLLAGMVRVAEHKDWEDISIQEICDAADVSRSTFYLHFQNKTELLDYGFSSLGEEMRQAPRTRDLDRDGVLGLLPVLFAFMTEHDHGFLFGSRGMSAATLLITRRLHATITEMIRDELASSSRYDDVTAGALRFISAGIFAELAAWHHEGGTRPADAVIRELDGLIIRLLTKIPEQNA